MDYKKIDYEKMYEDIINIDPRIRLVTICNSNGRVMYSDHREGIKNLLSSEETKKSNMQALARWGLRNALVPKIGKGKYSMAEYEKLKRITFPLEESDLLLVTTEVDADHKKIINNILDLLQNPSNNHVRD